MRTTQKLICIFLLAGTQAGCEPEVGSDEWCEDMVDTPKADWSANDVKAFAENCVFKSYEEED